VSVPSDVAALPFIDEHAVDIPVAPSVAWAAALATVRASADSTATRLGAKVLGCRPAGSSPATAPDGAGATVPGFRIAVAEPPQLLVLAGRHHFARYAIVLRVDATADGCRVRLESRAAFPGLRGRGNRAAVIGSGMHVRAVDRLLDSIRRRANDRSPI
jgi:hypothetical protein